MQYFQSLCIVCIVHQPEAVLSISDISNFRGPWGRLYWIYGCNLCMCHSDTLTQNEQQKFAVYNIM